MLIIGHRGAAGYEPENTLRSFRKAVSLDADMVEMDIFACRTGELVVLHDNTVDRTTNGRGYIWDLTYGELRSLDAGKGEKIPSLEEALNLLGKNCRINLELKGDDTARPVSGLIRKLVAERGWSYKNFYISSFNHYLLVEMNGLIPAGSGINISPLVAHLPVGYAAFAEQFKAYSVNISAEFVNAEFVKDAHERGMKAFAYLVNNREDMQRMKAMGVDGIFTDYPDITADYAD